MHESKLDVCGLASCVCYVCWLYLFNAYVCEYACVSYSQQFHVESKRKSPDWTPHVRECKQTSVSSLCVSEPGLLMQET